MNESRLKIIDPIQHIRDHTDRYLPGGDPKADYLASRLVLDALTVGVQDVSVRRDGDWSIVRSTTDWLPRSTEEEIRRLFTNVVPFPESGPNSMRSEVLLTAFARDVITAKGTQRIVISGDVEPASAAWRRVDRCGSDRVVAFRFASKRTSKTQ